VEFRMKRVLFIGAADPLTRVENHMRPLWPAFLSGYAEKHLGPGRLEFRFMTGNIEEELTSFRPDIVAISAITPHFGHGIEYARRAKEAGLPVIMGGMHISALPDSLTAEMDIGCIGEGEETFLELMRLFIVKGAFPKKDLSSINGIVFRDETGLLVRTPKRKVIDSLDDIPHPKRSLIGYGHREYLYTARGCQSRCVFCACHSHWGKVRYSSPEYVVEEIRELIENGVKVIRINEDNFIADKKRMMRIADLVVENGFHRAVRFSCWCRANDVTPEVVAALRAMNIVSVKMGLESGSDRTLRYLKGGVTVKNNWTAVNLLKDAGIQVNGDFIIGAPEETAEEMMQTYDFIRKSRLDFVDINVLSPLPGTAIWDYCIKRKLIAADIPWEAFQFKSSSLILSQTLTGDQLGRIYKKFQRLRLFKTIKALPGTPWLDELPKIVAGRLLELAARPLRRLTGLPARACHR
jgi:radical SAM superfamily enzyme YgiQ (UPF0313 family)